MVKICSFDYPKSNEELYQTHYSDVSYELHDFQKWTVEGIVTGNHVLVCCPTGSGKTFGGEFAIRYFHSKQKKVIYTTPIKALSNEKFHSFTNKFPDITIGLITGDIKTNPDADVLIMTTEILMNKLYQFKSNTNVTMPTSISFDMNIEHDLGCVVFDEIHFINDEHRGNVWEQCIMLLPDHVQMVGLSATLDNPERFATWLETKGAVTKTSEKEVFLTRKQKRAVPLVHYSFITVPNIVNKRIKDKQTQQEIRTIIDKPIVIQDCNNVFQLSNCQTIQKTIKLFEKNNIRVKRPFVLNKVSEYLVQNDMLPALCYLFSRKQLEICAEELTTNLLEFDSKIPYTVDRECEHILRKLPNYEEYLHLPEYIQTVKLLRKGIGIHHAGLMPVLREMTEILFAKGFIKMLFCTETMSVGINLPVKTTIFTDVYKFNGDNLRMLYSHEYTQAAGRAGRLGLDTVGHVIHLNNLFRNVDLTGYKIMMNNQPQTLTSKFKLSYNLLLNLIDIGDKKFTEFTKKSMATGDLNVRSKELHKNMNALEMEIKNMKCCIDNLKTPLNEIVQYIEFTKQVKTAINKKKKELERNIANLKEMYRFIEQDKTHFISFLEKQEEFNMYTELCDMMDTYFHSEVSNVLSLLIERGYIEGDNENHESLTLTTRGKIASQLHETHCLVFETLYTTGDMDKLTSKELVALFSCFTNVKVNDNVKDHKPNINNEQLHAVIENANSLYGLYQNLENSKRIQTGFDYFIHFDLLNYVIDWCDVTNTEHSKMILQQLGSEKGIFLGEFVKSLLKINNIACEFEKIAEFDGNVALLSKLKEIPQLTLKYVVTNQSLYV